MQFIYWKDVHTTSLREEEKLQISMSGRAYSNMLAVTLDAVIVSDFFSFSFIQTVVLSDFYNEQLFLQSENK